MKKQIKAALRLLRTKEKIPITQIVDNQQILKGKTALILGGTGGIGFAIAEKFAESGANIIISGSNETSVSEKVAFLNEKYKGFIKGCIINLFEPEYFAKKIEECSKLFGSIDIFINSAGVHTENVDFWTVSDFEFDRVININLKSCFFITREVASYMIKNKIKGNIVLVSSSRGSEPAWSPYGISKWGMDGMVRGFAKILLPHDIAVNCVAPGTTATKLIGFENGSTIESSENGLGRMIMPSEVADFVRVMVCFDGVLSGETIHFSAGRGLIDIR